MNSKLAQLVPQDCGGGMHGAAKTENGVSKILTGQNSDAKSTDG